MIMQVYDFIRDFTAKPMSTREAVLGCAAKDAMDIDAGMVMVVTTKGGWVGFKVIRGTNNVVA
jgi:hypothetical protein